MAFDGRGPCLIAFLLVAAFPVGPPAQVAKNGLFFKEIYKEFINAVARSIFQFLGLWALIFFILALCAFISFHFGLLGLHFSFSASVLAFGASILAFWAFRGGILWLFVPFWAFRGGILLLSAAVWALRGGILLRFVALTERRPQKTVDIELTIRNPQLANQISQAK